jgi:glycosyltransferase involved in cell wall biosynthesis
LGFAGKKILIIVENLPVPFDRRVWQEAQSLKRKGCQLSIICPKMKGYNKTFEVIDDIKIYRHPLIFEAKSGMGYLLEWGSALFYEFYFALKIYLKEGFHVIQACNPPDIIFLIGLFFKLFGVKYIFDHHDLCVEAFETKFQKRGLYYYLLAILERCTFLTSDYSIATNESYKKIAIQRGKMKHDKVFVVRNGPNEDRFKEVVKYNKKKKYIVSYLGVMGKSDGLNILIDVIDYIVNLIKIREISFVLMGDGIERKIIEEDVINRELHEYVSFTGRISDARVAGILAVSDVCVNPDEYNVFNNLSTMNKIMEYMYFSKPIVQFDMKEGRFSASDASFYAKRNDSKDFANKILELIDNPTQRRKMGEFGKRRFEDELKWEYSELNLIKLYSEIFHLNIKESNLCCGVHP